MLGHTAAATAVLLMLALSYVQGAESGQLQEKDLLTLRCTTAPGLFKDIRGAAVQVAQGAGSLLASGSRYYQAASASCPLHNLKDFCIVSESTG